MAREHQRPSGDGVRRVRDERGATLVELSLSIVLLLTLIFGIVTLGLILSFKQGMTQAAAEGARAAVTVSAANASSTAATAAAKSVNAFGKTCGSGGLTCTYNVAPCTGTPAANCITVQLTYDYEHYPLLPAFPLISNVLPDTLRSTSVTQINS